LQKIGLKFGQEFSAFVSDRNCKNFGRNFLHPISTVGRLF
jgi:hypothetical protein